MTPCSANSKKAIVEKVLHNTFYPRRVTPLRSRRLWREKYCTILFIRGESLHYVQEDCDGKSTAQYFISHENDSAKSKKAIVEKVLHNTFYPRRMTPLILRRLSWKKYCTILFIPGESLHYVQEDCDGKSTAQYFLSQESHSTTFKKTVTGKSTAQYFLSQGSHSTSSKKTIDEKSTVTILFIPGEWLR